MNWIAISGSWRYDFEEIREDVRKIVGGIIQDGDGIVTGGALGVDYWATQVVILKKSWNQVKVVLPTSLEIYSKHYFQRANEGLIDEVQAEMLIDQLYTVKLHCPRNLVEMDFTKVDKKSYYARNSRVLDAADKVYAFQVNKSAGVQDTIDKAKSIGIPVIIWSYTSEQEL